MNVGIVVESERDAVVYPELIRKIRNDIGVVAAIPCGNDVRLMNQFVRWLKYFHWHAQASVNKALVIRDSDCTGAGIWEAKMKRILDQSGFVPSFPVHFYATRCEVESWLLADENAINQAARNRHKQGSVPAIKIEFESYRNAKELFMQVLSKVRLPADPLVYGEIAKAANFERIAARCPYFQHFVENVRAC